VRVNTVILPYTLYNVYALVLLIQNCISYCFGYFIGYIYSLYIHTHIHTYIHTHTHIHTYIHTYIHTTYINIHTYPRMYQYSKTKKMHFLYSFYYELTASTCFEHYLLIFRRRCRNNNWYIACVLCGLAATRNGVSAS
jgi:hypothetical protein